MITHPRRLVLASASPRRQELLRTAGYSFDVVVPEVEEAHDASLSCDTLTMENAKLKAVAGLSLAPDALVIGADTLVYLDDQPLGKPRDLSEARTMLRLLSGRSHHVCTGVALASAEQLQTFAVVTQVQFRKLTEEQITEYLELVHVLDKAGAYAAQEHGEKIISHIHGSLTNVIGLPMEELHRRINR